MGLSSYYSAMKLFLSLAVVVASVSSDPRYIVLPIEDVDLSALVGQTLPVYRMPGLMRQARQVEDELNSFQQDPLASSSNAFRAPHAAPASRRDSEGADSNAYAAPHAAPAHTGPDHVDYGAYTGGYGAFGWYTDHPVLLAH